MKITAIIVTFQRPDDCNSVVSYLNQTEIVNEIIVINNSPHFEIHKNSSKIKIILNQINKGVAQSRNQGLSLAQNDTVWFIDDDIIFDDINLDYTLTNIYKYFKENSNLAIVASNIYSNNNKDRRSKEIPFRKKNIALDKERQCAYFIGASFIVCKSRIDELSYFLDDKCFYGMEELDLSLRLIKKGFEIYYMPQLSVVHLGNPNGRLPNKMRINLMLNNRYRIISRELGGIYTISHMLTWWLHSFLILKVIIVPKVVWFLPKTSKIDAQSKKYITSNYGRLYY